VSAAQHFASGRGRAGLTESEVYYVTDATGATGPAAVRSMAASPRCVDEITTYGSSRPPGERAVEVPRSQVCIPLEDVPVVAVTFSDGSTVRCAPDHLFLLDRSTGIGVYAEHLEIGLRVSLPVYPAVGMALRWHVHRDPCSRRWAADPPYVRSPGNWGLRWYPTRGEAATTWAWRWRSSRTRCPP